MIRSPTVSGEVWRPKCSLQCKVRVLFTIGSEMFPSSDHRKIDPRASDYRILPLRRIRNSVRAVARLDDRDSVLSTVSGKLASGPLTDGGRGSIPSPWLRFSHGPSATPVGAAVTVAAWSQPGSSLRSRRWPPPPWRRPGSECHLD